LHLHLLLLPLLHRLRAYRKTHDSNMMVKHCICPD
jgi:hypothetical protein